MPFSLKEVQTTLQANFLRLYEAVEEKNHLNAEMIIADIVAIRAQAHQLLALDPAYNDHNKKRFGHAIDHVFFEIKTWSTYLEHIGQYRVFPKAMGVYLLFSELATLILLGKENNIASHIVFVSELIAKFDAWDLENFLNLFLKEVLKVDQRRVPTPGIFVLLNVLDYAVLNDKHFIFPLIDLFSMLVQKSRKNFPVVGLCSFLSLNLLSYERGGRSAVDSLVSAISVGSTACMNAAMNLYCALNKLMAYEHPAIIEAITRRKQMEAEEVLASSGSGAMSSERSSGESSQPENSPVFFKRSLNSRGVEVSGYAKYVGLRQKGF